MWGFSRLVGLSADSYIYTQKTRHIRAVFDWWIINAFFYDPLHQIAFIYFFFTPRYYYCAYLSCISREFSIYMHSICWVTAFPKEQRQKQCYQNCKCREKITCIPGLFIWEAKFIGSLSRACNIRNMSTVSSLNLTCKENKPDHECNIDPEASDHHSTPGIHAYLMTSGNFIPQCITIKHFQNQKTKRIVQ